MIVMPTVRVVITNSRVPPIVARVIVARYFTAVAATSMMNHGITIITVVVGIGIIRTGKGVLVDFFIFQGETIKFN